MEGSRVVLAFTCAALLFAAGRPAGAQGTAAGKPLAYRVFADVVSERVCVPQMIFNPGATIVWRAEIDDPAGVRVTPANIASLGLRAVVVLKDGTRIPLRYGIHPPFPNAPATDTYWASSYHVGNDHPTGTLPWTLVVTDNAGNSVTFTPIGQANGISVLTIADKVAPSPKP